MFKRLKKFLFTPQNADILRIYYYQAEFGPFLKTGRVTTTEPFYTLLEKKIAPYITKNSMILDAGCGLGRLALTSANRGAKQVIGIDSNPTLTFESRAIAGNHRTHLLTYHNQGNCDFQTGDIHMLPFAPSSFSLALCINVLDRIKSPKIAISQLHRVLKKGGILVLCDPYEWKEEVTPVEEQVDDMKTLLDPKQWEILFEQDNIPYLLEINPRKIIQYKNHLLLVKKR